MAAKWLPRHRRLREENPCISVEMEARIVEQLSRTVEDHHLWKISWRVFVFVGTLIGILTLYGMWNFKQLLDYWNQEIDSRIASEFETHRITAIIEEVAKNESAELIRSKVQPAVDRFNTDLGEFKSSVRGILEGVSEETKLEMNIFRERLNASRVEIKAEYERVEAELSKLRQRNALTALADDAIANGSRASLDKLETMRRLAEFEKNSALLDASLSEILRVKATYIGTSRVRGRVFTIGGEKPENKTTNVLIGILLLDKKWDVRTMTASYLKERKDPGVIEALFACAAGDKNLYVVAQCVRALEALTGEISSDVFGYEKILAWWQDHGPAFNFYLQYGRND